MRLLLFGNYKLKLILGSFILGLSSLLIFGYYWSFLILSLSAIAISVKKKVWFWLIIPAYILGMLRVAWLPETIPFFPGRYNLPTKVCVEPDLRMEQQKLVLCSQLGKILATVSRYPEFFYGDHLIFKGRIERPGEIDGFRYDRYLALQGVYLVSYQPTLEKFGDSHGGLYGRLLNFKNRLRDQLTAGMKEPEAGLGNALILGYRHTLDTEYMDRFSLIGISHMIAISGTHITLLAVIWQRVARIFWRRPKLILTAGFLVTYVVLTGSSASALRSLLMGLMSLMIVSREGKQDAGWLLLSSAALMLSFNPLFLIADLGFQLSYLAMIALIYFYPTFNFYLARIRMGKRWRAVWELLLLTILSQLLTAPIIAVNFGIISLIAPVANLALLWIFPFLMATLLGGLSLALFFPVFSRWFFFPAYLGLAYVFLVSQILSRIPLASIDWRWSWGGAVVYYFGLFLVYYLIRRQQKDRI